MRNGYTSYKEARKHINFHASKLVESRQKSEVGAIFKTITKVVSDGDQLPGVISLAIKFYSFLFVFMTLGDIGRWGT